MRRGTPRGPQLLVVLGVTACLVAVAVGLSRLATTAPDTAGPVPSAGPAVRTATGTPSGPAGPDDPAPVELVAEQVGLRMPVVPVGVAADGQMELPPNPRQLGWYRFGPAPSAAAGSAVLAGHVDSKQYGVGPLVRLRRVRPGDEIRIELGGDRVLRFRTTSVVNVAKKSLPELGVFDRDGRRLLRVVTCGGAYDRARGGYQDNVVVTAVPLA